MELNYKSIKERYILQLQKNYLIKQNSEKEEGKVRILKFNNSDD